MSDFKAIMHQIRFRLGLRPRPFWGSSQRSPDPLAGFKGATSKGREGEGRKGRGRGREGKGRKDDLCFKLLLGPAYPCLVQVSVWC